MNTAAIVLLLTTLLMAGCNTPMTQIDSAAQRITGDVVETAAIPAPSTGESNASPLTKEQAEAIALRHAGLTADQVTQLRTEYEIDDGVPRFEVHFRQGSWEYDYEIHADTGAILSYDRDH